LFRDTNAVRTGGGDRLGWRQDRSWANAVVEARYSLSVPEQWLVLWLAAQLERDNYALRDQTIGVLELQEITDRDSGGSAYRQFEVVCDKLRTRLLEIRLDETGDKRRKITPSQRIQQG
jgi:hypothetical protein